MARWSGRLCWGSGTSDLSLCHDGSPSKKLVPVHSQACTCDKEKIPTEYPFSFLAHLLTGIKETDIFSGRQLPLMVHQSMSTRTGHPNTLRKSEHTAQHSTHFHFTHTHTPLSALICWDKAVVRAKRNWIWATWRCNCCLPVANDLTLASSLILDDNQRSE